jgi:deoxyribonuclease V
MHNLDTLRTIQRTLSRKVITRDTFKKPVTRIAGIDLAFAGELAITACVITSLPPTKTLLQKTLRRKLDFPYVTTFMSFREGPPIIDIINTLKTKADLFLINAHGYAHPRYYGCASHVGVLTGVVTIGVATRNLCGVYDCVPQEVGETVAVYCNDRQVGWVLQSKEGCRPIFVSPGHKIGLDSSLKIVKECLIDHKLPEPLWLAHRLANDEKRRGPSRDART